MTPLFALILDPYGRYTVFGRSFPSDLSTHDALNRLISIYRTNPTYHPGNSIVAYRWDSGFSALSSVEENYATIHGGMPGTVYTGFSKSDLLKTPIPL